MEKTSVTRALMMQGTSAPRPRARTLQRLCRAMQLMRFYLVASIFCVGSFTWSILAGLLYRWRSPNAGQRFGRAAISRGFRGGLWLMRVARLAQFDLSALDGLNQEGPMVIACNHRSLLDAVLVISRLPRAVCISKAGLWDNPALGGSVRLAGYIRNDAPLTLVRAGIAALRQDAQLVIFPEGTRGSGDRMGAFKGGFALIARGARVPIQTVYLDYSTPYLGPGWKLLRAPQFPLVYRVRLGERFAPTQRSTADTLAIVERHFEDLSTA
jgi:1-acyl-sn-glycerol-3-phosphate acyltransferase